MHFNKGCLLIQQSNVWKCISDQQIPYLYVSDSKNSNSYFIVNSVCNSKFVRIFHNQSCSLNNIFLIHLSLTLRKEGLKGEDNDAYTISAMVINSDTGLRSSGVLHTEMDGYVHSRTKVPKEHQLSHGLWRINPLPFSFLKTSSIVTFDYNIY